MFRIILLISYPLSLLFLYPLALLRKKNKTGIFFFFDKYAIGGAQRIHIDILNSLHDTYKEVYFTRFSKDKNLKEAFYSIPNTKTEDIHFWCDNLLLRIFSVHYYAFYINRHKEAQVFSSISTFFYDMLPFFNKHVKATELLHNFNHTRNGLEFFGLANAEHLTHRIVYDTYTYNNILKQYQEYNKPATLKDRILFIEPGVTIPPFTEKNYELPLTVLYAGRGGPQKRIPLLDKIAEQCIKGKLPITFHFAGTMMDELSAFVKDNSVLHGEISRMEEMNRLYQQSNVIILTSGYEGFPMFIKEGMSWGCIPVVTALEGNKTHLFSGENSLLIFNVEDEASVIKEGIDHLEKLTQDKELRIRLTANAYNYAKVHFDKALFTMKYRKFFLGDNA